MMNEGEIDEGLIPFMKTGQKPDMVGNVRAAAWRKRDKNGREYLSVNLGGMHFNLFINDRQG